MRFGVHVLTKFNQSLLSSSPVSLFIVLCECIASASLMRPASCVRFVCKDVRVIPVQLVVEEDGMFGCCGDVWVFVSNACFVFLYAGG